ncbi:MAG: copper resistance protein CopC [Chloroflexi bacterium]|nr:copper resistance protein CopC [Chloroflexota bacterium]
MKTASISKEPKIKKFLIFLTIIALWIPFVTVSAHETTIKTANPAVNAILKEAPFEVRLVFTDEISPDGSSIHVSDANGKKVDLGNSGLDLNDPDHVTLVVKLPVLPTGVYRVDWEIKLIDGDSTVGDYFFGIGNVILPTKMPETEPTTEAEVGITTPTTTAPSSTTYMPAGWIGVVGIGLVSIAGLIIFISRKRK